MGLQTCRKTTYSLDSLHSSVLAHRSRCEASVDTASAQPGMRHAKMDETEKQSLKRQRAAVENDIDQKLLSYSRVDFSGGSADPENGLSTHRAVERDIENLLDQLSKINDSLSRLETENRAERQQNEHHCEILQEYKNDFKNTKAKLKLKLEREELLSNCRRDVQDFKDAHGSAMLSKERDAIGKAREMAESILSTAAASRERLTQQRTVFGNILDKTATLISKFPLVNDVIMKIQRKKRRDLIVLSIVIAACLFAIWLYWK
eukprot:NODE_703_length_1218_cov_726.855432_g507_i0.p1 GENE.NODE_703_length_1218_cov_726.855432_g507_i0~~NODE_703_length_1218_cov_726.855432_g507_i0.p1  ORF type:complete len:262 (+),score=19.65 NODE_703_length_1218_cov_726.855432_g507_i0:32-817(+)